MEAYLRPQSDRIVGETLSFLRRSINASAAVFYWVDEAMNITNFETLDMPSGLMQRYNTGMKEFDPALVRRLTDANKKIGTLDDQDINISMDYRRAYRGFLREYGIVDVVDLLLRTGAKAIAGIGLLKHAGATPFSDETLDWFGIHQYVEFNMQMHPDVRKIRTKDVLKEKFRLTEREDEVTRLLMTGASNLQIAESLGIGLPTVKTYVINILDKIDVESRASLISFLYQSEYF